MILAGVITNSFLSSAVIFLVTVASGSRLRTVFSWLIGDLSGDLNLLPIVAIFIGAGIVIIFLNARSLNLLMAGEEDARALGVDVRRVQITVYLAASLIAGAASILPKIKPWLTYAEWGKCYDSELLFVFSGVDSVL